MITPKMREFTIKYPIFILLLLLFLQKTSATTQQQQSNNKPPNNNAINNQQQQQSNDDENIEDHQLPPNSPAIEKDALQFLIDVNKRSFSGYRKLVVASWDFENGITKETEEAKAEAEAENYNFEADIQKEVMERFPDWDGFGDVVLKRMFSNFAIQGPGNMTSGNIVEMTKILTKMQSDFATTTICDYQDKSKCDLRIDRDINRKLSGSKDLDEKTYYWTAWHDAMGKKVTAEVYEKFIGFQNEMARANDFEDMGTMWITQYNDYSDDWTPEQFKEEISRLEGEVRPFYNKLHAYVRMKLKRNSEKNREAIEKAGDGYLPIEILGNMWGQDWVSIDEETKPYPGFDVNSGLATKALKKANYTVPELFREADNFFADLGLMRVPETFWNYSRFERPSDGRDVVCHPSAWYFINGTDVRITMCAEVTLDDLITVQHEMGHIQYFLQYKDLPHVFQDGANPGFHEAVGDSLALSIMTPTHLQCTLKLDLGMPGLCDDDEGKGGRGNESTIISEWEMNFLYMNALQKIPFLFFSHALEEWRWSVFNNSIPKEDYNKEWWSIRAKQQGVVVPPSSNNRSDSSKFFDPASKFHVVANEPYISYFVSSILQFQFFESMCHASGQYNRSVEQHRHRPLYKCDITGSKEAGRLLQDMMKLGCSTDWRTALEKMTGSREMSAKALLEYFHPLVGFLERELEKGGERACYGEFC